MSRPDSPASGSLDHPGFPLVDWHVHLSDTLTLEDALELSRRREVQFGIVEHPGSGSPIVTDDDLRAYIARLRATPFFAGLQPVYPGWSAAFSPALIGQLDYVLMDALTMPDGAGEWTYLWQVSTFVEDGEAFMERYVSFAEQLLQTERIDIFAWPTFLPACLAREYDRLWTRRRMQRLVDAAHDRGAALEINALARVPSAPFIELAKHAGLKFTFGTDSRNQNAGRLAFCREMARTCDLRAGDMYHLAARE